MDEAVVRHHYTEMAAAYIDMIGTGAHVEPEDLRFLERHLGRCEGRIIDAGCGPGHLTAHLAGLGRTVTGIDLVPAFIDSARTRWPDVDYIVGSLNRLRVPAGSLSGALAWYSLIHSDTGQLLKSLSTLREAMRLDGVLVVGYFEGDIAETFEHKVVTAYRRPADEMSALLSAAGFTEVDRLCRPGTGTARPHAALAARAV